MTAPQPQQSAQRVERRWRIAATLTGWAVAVALGGWLGMLIVGAAGMAVGYPTAMALGTIGTGDRPGAATRPGPAPGGPGAGRLAPGHPTPRRAATRAEVDAVSRGAMYVFDPAGPGPRGRCVAYAHYRADGCWHVQDLRTGRDTAHPTREAAAERLVELAAADPALTLGGAR